VEDAVMEMETGIGYFGSNGRLYCSEPCARTAGVTDGRFVDEEEYESLVEAGTAAAATVCPVCGADFAVEWPGRTRID
jgi:hypothetical protein